MVKIDDNFHIRKKGPGKGRPRRNPYRKPKQSDEHFIKKTVKGTEIEGGVEIGLTGPKAYFKVKKKL